VIAAAKSDGLAIGLGLLSSAMGFLNTNQGGVFLAYMLIAGLAFLLHQCRRDHRKAEADVTKLSVRVAQLETSLKYEAAD